jgi:aldehyde dehydrogenase (NAD+)
VIGESKLQTYEAVIGGDDVSTQDHIDVVDPAVGTVFASVAAGDSEAVRAAVAAAQEAFPAWAATSPAERSGVLRALAATIRAERDELARAESRDTGKPLRQAFADVDTAARYFEFNASAGEVLYGDTLGASADRLAYTVREPLGVTGHIVPWNYPLQVTARSVAPSIAAGNCVVVKPAEEAPLTPIMLARLARRAGLPDGVLNVVPGYGPTAGAALSAHPGVSHLSFTGSSEVGKVVCTAAASNHTPTLLELGGKSPNIVFEDADLREAVPAIVNSILQNAGQTCSAGARLLVAEEIHADLVDQLRVAFSRVVVGPGLEDPDLGPLISEKQRMRVREMVTAATESGDASLVVGGGPPPSHPEDGYFYAATLLDDVNPASTIAREEVFGPVLCVTPFRSEEHAVELANATDYGLIAAIWTANGGRALRLAHEVRAGQIFINSYGAGGGVEVPFGGVGKSGYGREKGYDGLLGYTRVKAIVAMY